MFSSNPWRRREPETTKIYRIGRGRRPALHDPAEKGRPQRAAGCDA